MVDSGAGEGSGEPPRGEAVQTLEVWSKAFRSRERLPAGEAPRCRLRAWLPLPIRVWAVSDPSGPWARQGASDPALTTVHWRSLSDGSRVLSFT